MKSTTAERSTIEVMVTDVANNIAQLRSSIRKAITNVREGKRKAGTFTDPVFVADNLFLTGGLQMKLFAVAHRRASSESARLVADSSGTREEQIALLCHAATSRLQQAVAA